ncbi:hypothetical protein [uncultured Fretibacterium sp.]|uniref:hypothetical protein n=1 Tax=uncultured Fretibacterium sp. TaxID=1678694 RepID=UPI0028DC21A3|nr:hypothetical protein [uncultured Fretibacterium sp.]
MLNYLEFAGWLILITWIASYVFPRYIMPSLHPLCDALEELHGGSGGMGFLGAPLSLLFQIILSLALTWLLTGWSAWCVLYCRAYTRGMTTGRIQYYLTGLFCCEFALSRMAKADRYRGFFLSVLPFAMAMGAFIVYSVNPASIRKMYPWLVRWMGFYF